MTWDTLNLVDSSMNLEYPDPRFGFQQPLSRENYPKQFAIARFRPYVRLSLQFSIFRVSPALVRHVTAGRKDLADQTNTLEASRAEHLSHFPLVR